jgi:hypothetical protein
MTRRKSCAVTEAEDIAGSFEDITGAARIGKSGERKAGLHCKGISDISDKRSGSGETIMAKRCGVAGRRKEGFIA